MKIVDITTTQLFYPHTKPIQDATIPAPPPGAGGRGQLFVHIHTDEGVEGLGIGQSSPGVRQVVEDGFRNLLIGKDAVQHRTAMERHVLACAWLRT